MAIILKKLKGKPINRDITTADWNHLLTLLKVLLILFIVFSGFHWIVKKKVDKMPIIPTFTNAQAVNNKQGPKTNKIYTVRSGDTLWSIASNQYPNEDPEKMIKEIEKLNHLSQKSIRAGQPLRLP